MFMEIVNVLKEIKSNATPKFKFWVKQTFRLSLIGSCDIVYIVKNNLPLITHEEIFYKIADCHTAVGHCGRDKTWAEIKAHYGWIPLQAVVIYINMCDHCQGRRAFPKPPVGKPIISIGFLTRLQVDLIDMRSVSYEENNFIMHVKDHFSKFSWLYALKTKEAVNVAKNLRELFYTFGPPKILQSDNGKEFVAKVIHDLKNNWPDLTIINGRPRHPQSQGLVERSNAVVQKMLGKWLEINKTLDWPSGLGPVMLALNNATAQSTKKTPYEMVFGQRLRHEHSIWETLHCHSKKDSIMNEEDLDESIINQINMEHDSNSKSDVSCPIERLVQMEENEDESFQADTAHKRIRDEGEANYIRAAERQDRKYERSIKKLKNFQINDIVGLKIADVDRSNTSASILPCKIIKIIEGDETSKKLYKVATLYGVISNSFLSSDFRDLSDTLSIDLRKLNLQNLSEVTFIQACQAFTQYKSIHACKCVGSCETNRCPCRKQSIKCCSKCHRGKCSSCKNVD